MAGMRKRPWKSGDETKYAWQVTYTDQHGKRTSRQFPMKCEADHFRSTVEYTHYQPCPGGIRSGKTVAQAITTSLEARAKRVRGDTIKNDRSVAKHHVIPFLGRMHLSDLTRARVHQFHQRLLQGDVPDGTPRKWVMARKAVQVLHYAFEEAKRLHWVADNAALEVLKSVDAKPPLDAEREPATDEAVAALLATVQPPLILTTVRCGLGSAEARALRWEDVDREKNVLRVRRSVDSSGNTAPSKSRRDVPLPPDVRQSLLAHKLASPPGSELVFPSKAGRTMDYSVFVRTFAKAQIEAGLYNEKRIGPVKKRRRGFYFGDVEELPHRMIKVPRYSPDAFRLWWKSRWARFAVTDAMLAAGLAAYHVHEDSGVQAQVRAIGEAMLAVMRDDDAGKSLVRRMVS